MDIILNVSADYTQNTLIRALDTAADREGLDILHAAAMKDIRKAQTMSDIYVPEIIDRLDKIHVQTNYFWIFLRNEMMDTQLQVETDSPSTKIQRANAVADEIGALTKKLREEARDISAELGANLLGRGDDIDEACTSD